mmetsp:Transcript_24247/g.79026  ORF Transcript_24247/g.79026 Transcript_24247/m.79026 type:complete len:181 (+) Transcript_24247:53-595(+)
MDVQERWQELQSVQSCRVELYREFSTAFDEHLRGGGAAEYAAACSRITAAFQEASTRAREVERVLRDERVDLAELVRRVQVGEKEKLEMTAVLQVLRKEHAQGLWSWQEEADDRATPLTVEQLQQQWGLGTGRCACVGQTAEPTRVEYEGALQEATQALQRAVDEINDALDEFRCEVMES